MPHTHIIKLDENIGLAKVRKCGLSLVSGEYIIHCDSDDWIDLNMFEKLYVTAKNTNSDIVISEILATDGIKSNLCGTYPRALDVVTLTKYLLCGRMHGSLCNKLVKKDLYNEIVYAIGNIREDITVTIQLILRATKVSKIDGTYYYYYINNSSMSRDSNPAAKISSFKQSKINYSIIESVICQNENRDKYTRSLQILGFKILMDLWKVRKTEEGKTLWDNAASEFDLLDVLVMDVPIVEKVKYIISKLRLY